MKLDKPTQRARCKECSLIKSISDFYRNVTYRSGYTSKCKVCILRYSRAYNRIRYQDPAYRAKKAVRDRQYRSTTASREKDREYKRTTRMRYPGKVRARHKVSNALARGRLKRLPCEVCGARKVEAHHTDYRRPLLITWLCRTHHLEAEGKRPLIPTRDIMRATWATRAAARIAELREEGYVIETAATRDRHGFQPYTFKGRRRRPVR